MPIGVITNVLAVAIGGIIGTAVGPRISERFKNGLNTIFGICAMTMGVSSIALMENMPAVILSVIVGTCLGFVIHLGERITAGAMYMQKGISRVFGEKLMPGSGMDKQEYEATLVTVIVLFCASGTGIYGSIVSGMTGDHSILLAKSILDLPTALIFACALGGVLLLATGFRMIKVKELPIVAG